MTDAEPIDGPELTRRDLKVGLAAMGLGLMPSLAEAATPGLADIPMPSLSLVTDIFIRLAPTVEMGQGPKGLRRIVPILDGTAKGPRLNGKVLPGGADFQLIRPDSLTEIQARYIIEADTGERIYVENTGLRHAPPDVMARLLKGEVVDPALVYFRSSPRFEAPAGRFGWMESTIFICSGARYPEHVQLRFFAVS